MTIQLLETDKIKFLKGAEIALLSLSRSDMAKILRLLNSAATDLLSPNGSPFTIKGTIDGLYEIRFKDYLIIFKTHAQYIEILSIVNSHLFKSPNEAVLYERA